MTMQPLSKVSIDDKRRSVQIDSPGSLQQISALAAAVDGKKRGFLDQAYDNLPIKFDVDAIEKKRNPTPNCQLCLAVFTGGLGKNPIRHCKRCAKSVCEVCSLSRRVLSRSDKEQHRVCDQCDTEMDNFKLKENHKEVLEA